MLERNGVKATIIQLFLEAWTKIGFRVTLPLVSGGSEGTETADFAVSVDSAVPG